MTRYRMSEIPEIDPAEFDLYRGGRRIGGYFHQVIVDGVLDIGHTLGWVPIGKTSHQRVLDMSDDACDVAVMYTWGPEPEEMIWFHLLEIDSE